MARRRSAPGQLSADTGHEKETTWRWQNVRRRSIGRAAWPAGRAACAAAAAPERLDVKAKCSLETEGDWYRISALDLDVRGEVSGLDAEAFTRAAHEADAHCPVSTPCAAACGCA